MGIAPLPGFRWSHRYSCEDVVVVLACCDVRLDLVCPEHLHLVMFSNQYTALVQWKVESDALVKLEPRLRGKPLIGQTS